MWHQILLSRLAPGVIKSLDKKQRWLRGHLEAFLVQHQLLDLHTWWVQSML